VDAGLNRWLDDLKATLASHPSRFEVKAKKRKKTHSLRPALTGFAWLSLSVLTYALQSENALIRCGECGVPKASSGL